MDDRRPVEPPKRGFFKTVLIWIRNYLTFVGGMVMLLSILFGIGIARLAKMESSKPSSASSSLTKEKPTRLTLDLRTPLAESEPDFTQGIMNRFFGVEAPVYLPDVRAALRRAAEDERVARLELEITALQGTPAEFAELRRALEEFKAKGKPVHVVLNDASDWAYYVATGGTDIVLNPASGLFLSGPTFHLTYFGEALKKLGVDIEVVRAGKYKAAFEPLVADQPSAESLEQYGAMNESLLKHIVEAVSAGRKKTPEEVRGWFKRSLYTPQAALEAGLVDKLGYGIGDVLTARETKEEPGMTIREYRRATEGEGSKQESVEGEGGIALIEAVGEIRMQDDNDSGGAGNVIAPGGMRKRLRWAAEESDVKAVVLRVSSPGGSAVASEMIWHEVKMLADQKPVVISMGAYAASGGYYIAAPARRIVAEPTTITGSIGVIGMLPKLGPFKEKYGVSFYVVTQSDRKSLLDLGQKMSPEDKALLDGEIDATYKTFLQRVAEGRNLKVEDVHALAQGRVYTALEAKELALVDEIGGLQAAFNAAKELAGFDVNKLYPVLRYSGNEMSLEECLKNPARWAKCFGEGDTRLSPLPSLDTPDELARTVRSWTELAHKERALALWPDYKALFVR